MGRWPWDKRDPIRVEDVDPLPDEALPLVAAVIDWARASYRPRQRPVRRWKPLTSWDRRGAEDASAAVANIRELIDLRPKLERECQQNRELLPALAELSSAEASAITDAALEGIASRIGGERQKEPVLRQQLSKARHDRQKALEPLEKQHRMLGQERNELREHEEGLTERAQELEAELNDYESAIAALQSGVQMLRGVMRGLR
jgi:chromosome segregation ATPase